MPVQPIEPTKGVKTTEFWLTVATMIASIAAAVAGALPEKWAAIATTVSAAIYTIARAFTKSNVTPE